MDGSRSGTQVAGNREGLARGAGSRAAPAVSSSEPSAERSQATVQPRFPSGRVLGSSALGAGRSLLSDIAGWRELKMITHTSPLRHSWRPPNNLATLHRFTDGLRSPQHIREILASSLTWRR